MLKTASSSLKDKTRLGNACLFKDHIFKDLSSHTGYYGKCTQHLKVTIGQHIKHIQFYQRVVWIYAHLCSRSFYYYSVSFDDFSILDQEIMTQVFIRIKVQSFDKVGWTMFK